MASISFLPDKHLFLVTSCINTNIGIFNPSQRYNQTLETISSIRKFSPNSLIFLADNSIEQLNSEMYNSLAEKCDLVANLSEDKDCIHFNTLGVKSAADCVITLKMIEIILNNPIGMKLVSQSKRLYKISGRYHLNKNFKEQNFDHYGKFVVKRYDTWRDDKSIAGLYLTRLMSFCPSLIKYFYQILIQSVDTVMKEQVDMEHAMYKNIEKNLVTSIDTLGLSGQVAPNGQPHID